MSGGRVGLAQWPVLAVAAVLHALQLGVVFFALVDLERTAPARWLPVAALLVALAAVVGVVLTFANVALETLARRSGAALLRLLDGAKAIALALLLALSGASILKLLATGSHLRASDLWFAYGSWRQVIAEGRPLEVGWLVGLPLAAALAAALFYPGLRRTRARTTALTPRRGLAVAGAILGAFAGLWVLAPDAARFAGEFVPEAAWAARARTRATDATVGDGAADPAAGAPIEAYRPGPPARPLDVVLVLLESVSWDLVARRPEAAPNLARLRAESIVFPRAYAPSTHSDYAQMAVLSSLHPRKFPEHDFYLRLDYPRTLLWDALAAAGYRTALFSCQNERWGNMLRYLDTPGLEVLRHAPDWPAARRRGAAAESKVFEETPVVEWARWLAAQRDDDRIFTYLNFQATHFPYEVPPDAPAPYAPAAIAFPATFVEYPRAALPVMQNRFFNALAYADAWLGEVVATLKREGRWERTLLVVAADHGEAFYEHEQPTHGTSLHEEQVRALLLFRVPGRPPREIAAPVSLLDLAPSLLAALGLPSHGNFQGRGDILDEGYSAAGRAFFFTLQGLVHQDGVLVDDWKLVVDRDRGRRRLYSLADDPAERTDLAATRPEVVERLGGRLAAFLVRQLTYYAREEWRQGRYPPPVEGPLRPTNRAGRCAPGTAPRSGPR